MRGDGESPGPALGLRPHGALNRGVPTLHPVEEQTAGTDFSPSSPPIAELHIADRAHFHQQKSFHLDPIEKPLQHPTFRFGNIVQLDALPETRTGRGYMNHVPLTVKIHVNSSTDAPVSSLLDTGASLSTIDADLLQRLGGQPEGEGMVVRGIGETKTLGFATVVFFIEARDVRDKQVFLECRHDFHVLPSFAPGVCLGRDFIDGHDLTISPARGRARVKTYTFAVNEQVKGPYATNVELHTVEPIDVPPGYNVWVPVDASGLAPGVDYCAHPRLSVTPDENVQLAGPVGLITHKSRRHILLGNFGTASLHLGRGTVVADAVAAHVGDVAQSSPHTFTLAHPTPASPSATLFTASSDPDPLEGVADPIDAFELDDDSVIDPRHDAATTTVDDHFCVGIGPDGRPPEAVVEMLRRHTAAFALDGRPGLVTGTEMPIKLVENATLRPEPPRRAGPAKLAPMDAAIDQLLSWDVIEPSDSPVSFPVLMVRQYAKWRFCVDYRQLNAQTVPDRYPLPTIDSVFQTLSGKSMFSSLDAIRGYHQLPVKESDRWKTAFVCHRGLFQYKTVPFGLRNAPAVFQRLMDRLLGALRWKDAVVYIDDIVVATRTMSEQVAALETILTAAEREGLKFSPSKCTFAVGSLVLLGRKVSGAGVAVWQERASAVRDLARPTTLKELYHALGLFGYYRAFVRNYATIAEPLTRLTKGWRYDQMDGRYRLVNVEGRPVAAERCVLDWDETQQQSFEALKTAIASPPVLAHPDPSRPYILYVDASKDGFGVVLHQVFEADEGSVQCADDASSQSPSSARLHALAFARLPPRIARERWTSWLRTDRYFAPLLRDAEQSSTASSPDDVWIARDGLLVRRHDGRLALPEGALPELLRLVHEDNGHFGFYKTYLALSRDFWRPGLSVSVRAWVRHCRVCQHTKAARKTGALDVTKDPQLPFDTISVDLVHGLPLSRSGNNAAVVILCVFSRMVLIEPCSLDVTAEGIAAILSERILRYGWRPRRIVSDSEARFTGSKMTSLARSLGAEITPSPPYHQQANAVERAIQTIQHVLQSVSLDSRAHWDRRHAPAVELAMNSTPSVVTGQRPFDLVFISHPSVVHTVFDGEEHLGVGSFDERLAAAGELMVEVKELIAAARLGQKRRYDRSRASLPKLRVGDRVFLRLKDRPVPGTIGDKLDPRKMGPFAVEEVLSDHRVRLTLPADVAIDPVCSVEQLDLVPRSPDPFAAERERPSSSASSPVDAVAEADEDLPEIPPPPGSPPIPPRARRLPVALRGFDIGVLTVGDQTVLMEALREPTRRPRRVELGDRSLLLMERPVVFLSRLTTPMEKKMVAAELELRCLAWAFAKLAHLLEGALVTVVTDHQPMGAMLSSTSGVSYGPAISRCRALLMPHLPNLRFVARSGSSHANADALSRLRTEPGRSVSLGGHVLDEQELPPS
ncbi:hypothetical protein A4X13_0g7660 [Tilletia indica]|uniref:RNA-directed DNA polymerase n=1 Tax=Tilletia indica TaxID=43049 RepID=A0A8T8SIU7_9BASI|nr:hypothetical protein A4X13_0g7660 [Tilletia indica]